MVEEILTHRAALARARQAAGSPANIRAIKELIDLKQQQMEEMRRAHEEIKNDPTMQRINEA